MGQDNRHHSEQSGQQCFRFHEEANPKRRGDHGADPPRLPSFQRRRRHPRKLRGQSQRGCTCEHDKPRYSPKQPRVEVHRLAAQQVNRHQQQCERNSGDDVRHARVERALQAVRRHPAFFFVRMPDGCGFRVRMLDHFAFKGFRVQNQWHHP